MDMKGLIWHCEQMNLAKLRLQDVHICIIGKAIIPVANIINGCFLLFVIFVLGGMESSFTDEFMLKRTSSLEIKLFVKLNLDKGGFGMQVLCL